MNKRKYQLFRTSTIMPVFHIDSGRILFNLFGICFKIILPAEQFAGITYYPRKESTMKKIRKCFVRLENRAMESVYQIIHEQTEYIYNRELKNLMGFNMRYAFTSLNRTNHVLYAIADVIAHRNLRTRLAYGYNLKLARLVAIDTMDAINSELESYVVERKV